MNKSRSRIEAANFGFKFFIKAAPKYCPRVILETRLLFGTFHLSQQHLTLRIFHFWFFAFSAVQMSEPPSKRKKYTLTYKQAVVAEAKKSSNRAVARKHALDESLVRRWRKINDDLLAEAKTKTVQGETRSRRSGGGRHVPFQELEKRLFERIVLMRQCRRRVTRKSIKKQAKKMHEEANGEKPFEGSSGWCQNFLKRFRLATRIKTHQSQRTPLALVPKLLSFLSYMRSYFHDHPERELRSIYSMDELLFGMTLSVLEQ